jgi:hypothetical protein
MCSLNYAADFYFISTLLGKNAVAIIPLKKAFRQCSRHAIEACNGNVYGTNNVLINDTKDDVYRVR